MVAGLTLRIEVGYSVSLLSRISPIRPLMYSVVMISGIVMVPKLNHFIIVNYFAVS